MDPIHAACSVPCSRMFLNLGSNHPPAVEAGVLITGSPGKSPFWFFTKEESSRKVGKRHLWMTVMNGAEWQDQEKLSQDGDLRLLREYTLVKQKRAERRMEAGKPPGGKSLKTRTPLKGQGSAQLPRACYIVVNTAQEIEKLLGQINSHLCTHQSSLIVVLRGRGGNGSFFSNFRKSLYMSKHPLSVKTDFKENEKSVLPD